MMHVINLCKFTGDEANKTKMLTLWHIIGKPLQDMFDIQRDYNIIKSFGTTLGGLFRLPGLPWFLDIFKMNLALNKLA